MISRLVRSTDFERVLRTRSCASSPHFALHHVAEAPGLPFKRVAEPAGPPKLSTDPTLPDPLPVDEPVAAAVLTAPTALWFGIVVPKRHARRAVTRTLLKRQIRAAMGGHADALARGLWVVRLRAPFDRERFTSAASDALRHSARDELAGLLAKVARRAGAA